MSPTVTARVGVYEKPHAGWRGRARRSRRRAVRALLLLQEQKRLRHIPTVVIVDGPAMYFRAVLVAAALVAFVPAVSARDARSQAKEQVEFGIKVAETGLWKEAAYRWQKAVELDPTYSAAWNNLAIAYEHQGNFTEAQKAYEKALQLDPKNQMIRQNYDLFKEINDRAKRRTDR
jgi:tetratricopeptide (TPR) repeat protein